MPTWSVMRTVHNGEAPPPLPWERPARRAGRPELAALRPREADRHSVLTRVPRMAPPSLVRGGLLAADARLTALGSSLAHFGGEAVSKDVGG